MEQVKKYTVPDSKEERIARLQEAKDTLKKEFVGLDEIIDKIGESITPWYITPEVIIRPTIISLWGMTGTGKTSVVRRLMDLLGLANKAMYFDCGEESNQGNTTVASKINEMLNVDEDNNLTPGSANDFVFVFDEFQHARTINEHYEEVDKPNLRSVWNLLDNGIIKSDESNWETSYFCGFIEDFEGYVAEYPDVPIEAGKIVDPKDVENILNSIGFFYYDRGVPGVIDARKPWNSREEDEEENKMEKVLKPLDIIDDRVMRIIIRKLKGPKQSPKDIVHELFSAKTTSELLSLLQEAKKTIVAPKEINCNKSLIFILGNLDEAFRVEGEINPDIDADIFYDETSKVSVNDIKRALRKRFRAEQIARFGNSIIKYPTLKREHFKKVIKNEVSRIISDFKKGSGIDIKIDSSIYDLLYAEGVYPVQGVRPVFTTVSTIFTPLLSDIVINAKSGDTAELRVERAEEGYKLEKKTIVIKVGEKEVRRDIDLVLGELRRPESKKTRYINAVHEAGHAVIMSYLTGNLPIAIVSVSSNSGGFCITHDSDKIGEIRTKGDVQNNVMISMGGYLAEEVVFPDERMRLLGSGNDIETAWDDFSSAAYELGYFDPFSYCNYETYSAGLPGGVDDKEIKKSIRFEFDSLRVKTTEILLNNKDLIISVALKLGETGEMSGSEFLEYIKKNEEGTLTEERMKMAKEENSFDYYKHELYRLKE